MNRLLGSRGLLRAHALFGLILCCLVFPASAATYGTMGGGPFPTVNTPGPWTVSKNYTLELPVTTRILKTKIPLDTPEGALLVVMSEDKALKAELGEVSLPVFQSHPAESAILQKAGTVFHLTGQTAGKHNLRIEGFRISPSAELLVAQPQSPLTLKAQVKPLAAQTHQTITVNLVLQDEKPILDAAVYVSLRDNTVSAIRTGEGEFKATLLAPEVERRESLPIRIVASGRRFDKHPFMREARSRVMIIKSESRIQKVFANREGDIEVKTAPAKGQFRLDVIYGYQNKAIAWGQERFALDKDSETTFVIKRPEMARASDKALVKLLNMDTLGLEGQQVITLKPDQAALKNFKISTPPAPALPENKVKALEWLEHEVDGHAH